MASTSRKSPSTKKRAPATKAPAARRTGRPTCSDAFVAEFCARIARGESVRQICADPHMPADSTVMGWLAKPEHSSFVEQYARAKELLADQFAAEIIAIADTPLLGEKTKVDADGNVVEKTTGDMIEHRRLQVDARKWAAGKLAPKKYSDKLALGGAEDLGPVQTQTRELTDAERAMRLSRLISGNPEALAAIAATLGKAKKA